MTDAQEISVGEILASARKKKRLRYKKLSSELNIDEIYLVALEECNFDLIPGGEAYVKGFLRSYAKKLDLNPDHIIDKYLSSKEGSLNAPEKLSPKDTYVNLVRGSLLLDYAYILFDKNKMDLAISNARDSITNFEQVLLDKNPEENLIVKRIFPLGITYEAHAYLGAANFDILYFAYKKNGDRTGARQFLKDSLNHYTNAIATAPSQEESEKYAIERDFDMITLAELHLYRGNAYSWITKDWRKACKDWKVSRKLGNKEAGVNARQWKC